MPTGWPRCAAGAIVINIARGQVIDESALTDCVGRRSPRGRRARRVRGRAAAGRLAAVGPAERPGLAAFGVHRGRRERLPHRACSSTTCTATSAESRCATSTTRIAGTDAPGREGQRSDAQGRGGAMFRRRPGRAGRIGRRRGGCRVRWLLPVGPPEFHQQRCRTVDRRPVVGARPGGRPHHDHQARHHDHPDLPAAAGRAGQADHHAGPDQSRSADPRGRDRLARPGRLRVVRRRRRCRAAGARCSTRDSPCSDALWSGERVDWHGKHYTIDGVRFLPSRPSDRGSRCGSAAPCPTASR